MAFLRSMALAFLGIAFCTGCGDSSPKSWETGKSQASGQRPSAETASPKADDTVNNDDAATSETANPHKMTNPHGAMNPHGDMMMQADTKEQVPENDGKLDLDTAHWTVPKSWVRKVPRMPNFILAEYAIPKAEGDKADGRLTVSAAGGTVEGNIDRWKDQFGKKPEKESQETIDAGSVKITLVDLTGTFSDSMGPMAPAVTRPDYRMLGAIFQLPGEQELHFIKCYGPTKTIAAQADEFKGFLRSLKVDK